MKRQIKSAFFVSKKIQTFGFAPKSKEKRNPNYAMEGKEGSEQSRKKSLDFVLMKIHV